MSNTMKTIDDLLFEAIESASSYTHKVTAEEADYIQEQAKQAILTLIEQEKKELLDRLEDRRHSYYKKELNYAPDGDPSRVEVLAIPLTAIEIERTALKNITIEGEK